jgi:hypothetical protein
MIKNRNIGLRPLLLFFDRVLLSVVEGLRMNGNILIPFVVDCKDAGGSTPRMEEVEQCMEQLPRATQGAVAESLSNHEWKQFVQRFLRVGVRYEVSAAKNGITITKNMNI